MRVVTRPRHALASAAALALLAGLPASAAPTPEPLLPSLFPASATSDHACPPGCGHDGAAQHPLFRAIDSLAAASENPASTRLRLLEHVTYSPACYDPNLTEEEYAALLESTQLLPAHLLDPTLRYFTSTPVWFGEAQQSQSGTARRTNLTVSFPDDGANWGLSTLGFGGPRPNTLNQMFTNIFGAANVDRGREYVRQSLAAWARSSGLNYREVADDNAQQSTSVTRVATRGDIRIGGFPFTNAGGVLAYNVFPSSGSDMVINTNSQSSYGNSSSNYLFLRNVVAHEHGHGLGYIHTVPCSNVFLMEPSIHFGTNMLSIDERRGAARNYGDRYAGNANAANAHDFGDLTSPILRSVIERELSTNGLNGPLGSGADWFRFSLSSAQQVVVSAVPTGGVYTQGQQTSGCSGSTTSVNANQAGNLNIELRDSVGSTVLQSATSAGPGATETLNAGVLPAGEYVVRIWDAGPNAHQIVQLYDMTIRVGAGAGAGAPPQAVAGIDKRCPANANCFFMGDINSRPLEPGASLPASGYAWDLDGDGVFEITGAPSISRQYVSNGVYPVTLRVTDSGGRQAFDTIQLTVFGATTLVSTVSPNLGAQGQSIPVTITGTNLKNVTDASMVTVSGAGVTVTGTPVSNTLGTQLTGLSLVIAPGAAVGQRSITVSNADGTGTGSNLFTVEEGGPAPCPADWNNDSLVNSGDITAFLTAWLASIQDGTLVADFNNDGQVNSGDITAFLSAWLHAVQNGC